jgi:hypothetical protein
MNVAFLADDAKNRTFSEIWIAREHPHSVTHLLTSALLFIVRAFLTVNRYTLFTTIAHTKQRRV